MRPLDLLGRDVLRVMAGSEVAARILGQRWLDGSANLGCAGGPGVEPTSGGRTDRTRGFARDQRAGPSLILVRVRERDRVKQGRGVRMDRLGVELLRRRYLHQL